MMIEPVIRYLKISGWIIIFLIMSCNNEKARMIKGLSRTYRIDTGVFDYRIFKNTGIDSLKLILSENGTYRFSPAFTILDGYDGKWTLSDDNEYSNFIFECNNGEREENRTLFIDFKYKGKDYRLGFTR